MSDVSSWTWKPTPPWPSFASNLELKANSSASRGTTQPCFPGLRGHQLVTCKRPRRQRCLRLRDSSGGGRPLRGVPVRRGSKGSRAKAPKAKRFTLAALASQHARLQDLVVQLQEVASKLIAAAQVSFRSRPPTQQTPSLLHTRRSAILCPRLFLQLNPEPAFLCEASGKPAFSGSSRGGGPAGHYRRRVAWRTRRRPLEASSGKSSDGPISSASSDPLADLQAPSSLSTQRTAGRQKLQLKLAARDGSFFERVYSAAARRMYPAMRPASASELCQREAVMVK